MTEACAMIESEVTRIEKNAQSLTAERILMLSLTSVVLTSGWQQI